MRSVAEMDVVPNPALSSILHASREVNHLRWVRSNRPRESLGNVPVKYIDLMAVICRILGTLTIAVPPGFRCLVASLNVFHGSTMCSRTSANIMQSKSDSWKFRFQSKLFRSARITRFNFRVASLQKFSSYSIPSTILSGTIARSAAPRFPLLQPTSRILMAFFGTCAMMSGLAPVYAFILL